MTGRRGLAALLLVLPLPACSGGTSSPTPAASPAPTPLADPLAAPPADELAAAEDDTRSDSFYPGVGDPVVDALHYGLDLRWEPQDRELSGTAAVTFRATADADEVRLDLARTMTVEEVTLDGEAAPYTQLRRDLVVDVADLGGVTEDDVHRLVVTYAGTPAPVPAPSDRTDLAEAGMRVTADGWLWTLQSPYGAFTWFPVHDQPSDRALYDVRVDVPAPWTGVSGGALVSSEVVRDDSGGRRVTTWELDEPAAAYLTTLAVGDYVATERETASGLPVTTWTPRGDRGAAEDLAYSAEAVDWIEDTLGPYPFATVGGVLVDADSAMETQTLPTYGDTEYTRSELVVLHELVHQWYGDAVTPTDWRDLWMSEGMTTYLQLCWEVEVTGRSWRAVLGEAQQYARDSRVLAGPPGDPDPRQYGSSTVYYGPALMWHTLRADVGEDAFWSAVRAWPTEDGPSADRDEYLAWLVDRLAGGTDTDLPAFFDAWLDDRRLPRFDPVPLPDLPPLT